MESSNSASDVLFILLGAIMVLAMHGGFAFLEVGTVRKKNQVNALVKILCDFSISTIAYFFVGYAVAYGTDFLVGANTLSQNGGYGLVKFFFLLTFAAAIPAIISGGIAERARFYPQLFASAIIVGVVYPFFEGVIWNGNFGFQPMRMGGTFNTSEEYQLTFPNPLLNVFNPIVNRNMDATNETPGNETVTINMPQDLNTLLRTQENDRAPGNVTWDTIRSMGEGVGFDLLQLDIEENLDGSGSLEHHACWAKHTE